MPKSFSLTNESLFTSSRSALRALVASVGVLTVVACGAQKQERQETRDSGSTSSGHNTVTGDGGISTTVIVNPNPNGTDPIVGMSNDAPEVDGRDAGSTTTTTNASSTDSPQASLLCGSTACICNDGIDNDGDGNVDGMDQECTGPLDNDEGTFATGIPGDNRDPKWQDCFFDGNSGAGDDGCRYHTDCLTGEASQDEAECTLTQACIDFCRPLTPPGCDCFGCCEVPFEGAMIGIKLSDSCSLTNIDDTEACPRCVPTANCSNECGECELCLGKTLGDLPESCGMVVPPSENDGGTPTGGPNDGGGTPELPTDPQNPPQPPNTCDIGTPCETSADCAGGDYCRLGCCIDYTPQVL